MCVDQIARMEALQLFADIALERAHRDDDLRPLAVVAEAWTLAGYHDCSLVDTLPYQPLGMDERLGLVMRARRGRPKRLLRADARGLLLAIDFGAGGVLFSGSAANEALRMRWLDRSGHDYKREAA